MRTTLSTSSLAIFSLFLLSACGGETSTEVETSLETDEEMEMDDMEGDEMMKMSMSDLVKMGENFHCTIDDTDEAGTRTEGTMYVEGDTNFRGDFVMTTDDGTEQSSHIITKNRTSYMWSDDEPEGIMMKLEDSDDDMFADNDMTDEDNAAFDENAELNMHCEKWSPKASIFETPRNREFVDFQAQMQLMMQGSEEGESMCAACDMAPTEEEKEACRSAMGC